MSKQKNRKKRITYNEAWQQVLDEIDHAKNQPTIVREIKKYRINNLYGLKRGIAAVPKRTVIWQHTDKWHTAAIYIPKKQGKWYRRKVLDIIDTGNAEETAFRNLWHQRNGYSDKGYFPKLGYSRTSSIRQQQASYIVRDTGCSPNDDSKILGNITPGGTDKTHLISTQVTGIENHKGLLIDFDGFLNKKTLRKYEDWALNQSEKQDIIWDVNIFRKSTNDLHWQYIFYDKKFNVLKKGEWVDDRWTYFWYYDRDQDYLTRYHLYDSLDDGGKDNE